MHSRHLLLYHTKRHGIVFREGLRASARCLLLAESINRRSPHHRALIALLPFLGALMQPVML